MRVGTRILPLVYDDSLRDHPHACGDKTVAPSFVKILQGSSPCVWGQDLRSCNTAVFDGIIPMRVGTSINPRQCAAGRWDHPHACGDKKV